MVAVISSMHFFKMSILRKLALKTRIPDGNDMEPTNAAATFVLHCRTTQCHRILNGEPRWRNPRHPCPRAVNDFDAGTVSPPTRPPNWCEEPSTATATRPRAASRAHRCAALPAAAPFRPIAQETAGAEKCSKTMSNTARTRFCTTTSHDNFAHNFTTTATRTTISHTISRTTATRTTISQNNRPDKRMQKPLHPAQRTQKPLGPRTFKQL